MIILRDTKIFLNTLDMSKRPTEGITGLQYINYAICHILGPVRLSLSVSCSCMACAAQSLVCLCFQGISVRCIGLYLSFFKCEILYRWSSLNASVLPICVS